MFIVKLLGPWGTLIFRHFWYYLHLLELEIKIFTNKYTETDAAGFKISKQTKYCKPCDNQGSHFVIIKKIVLEVNKTDMYIYY